MNILITILSHVAYNYINAFHDAYRIKKGLKIYHGLNGLAYFATIGICLWVLNLRGWDIVFLFISRSFLRKVIFDTQLNRMRGLKWHYVTLVPKAITDKIQILIFGHNGRLPILVYAILWFIFEGILIIKNT